MKLSDFRYEFPDELVAQTPLPERDRSRLLVWDGRSSLKNDSVFLRLADELRSVFSAAGKVPVLLLVNDSKVYPARIRIRKESGARGEVLILSPQRDSDISCLLRPAKKLKIGDVLLCESSGRPAFAVKSLNPPLVDNISGMSLQELMDAQGEMPLPPYIERDPARMNDPSVSAIDRLRYQTVYARHVGSSAAPTAGLHFTGAVLEDCAANQISICGVTLHVGLGTFQPVNVENLDEHKMHVEHCSVPKTTMLKIIEHVENRWPIVFVGTTSFRAVESVLLSALGWPLKDACLRSGEGLLSLFENRSLTKEKLLAIADEWVQTDLFIRPLSGSSIYRPVCGDGIITNFHQPESTLVMLISALLGYENWKTLYTHAVASRYRLFSYGDSSLLIFPGAL
jgi:S-adenosylmethionine:tRNA ribosyltransferase-isomerase